MGETKQSKRPADLVIECPRCGYGITGPELAHVVAREWGRRGGAAGKGSPARRAAAILGAKARWARRGVSVLLGVLSVSAMAATNITGPVDPWGPPGVTLSSYKAPPPPELFGPVTYCSILCNTETARGMRLFLATREAALAENLKIIGPRQDVFALSEMRPVLLIEVHILEAGQDWCAHVDCMMIFAGHQRHRGQFYLMLVSQENKEGNLDKIATQWRYGVQAMLAEIR
jgi:hypothetical protein